MYDEILSSIDNIDECVMEAELNVLNALCNEYDKAIMIMENYNGDSYDCFDIFMEADESTSDNETPTDESDTKGQKRRNGILSRIIQAFKNTITKISMRILSFKFSRIIKKIEKAPDDAEFIMIKEIFEHSAEEVYTTLNVCVDIIEDSYDAIMTTVNDNDPNNPTVIKLDKDLETESLNNFKKATKEIKKLSSTKVSDDSSISYTKSDLLTMAKDESENFNKSSVKIREMLKNLNKAIKNTRYDENSPSNSVSYFKKTVNMIIKNYLAIIKVVIKRFNAFIKAESKDVKCTIQKIDTLTGPELTKWFKMKNPDNKYDMFVIDIETVNNSNNSENKEMLKHIISYFKLSTKVSNIKGVIQILLSKTSDDKLDGFNSINIINYDKMDDKLRETFNKQEGAFPINS